MAFTKDNLLEIVNSPLASAQQIAIARAALQAMDAPITPVTAPVPVAPTPAAPERQAYISLWLLRECINMVSVSDRKHFMQIARERYPYSDLFAPENVSLTEASSDTDRSVLKRLRRWEKDGSLSGVTHSVVD